MWQQGFYQQWPVAGQQQSSNNVDWGALAQAWIQNKNQSSNPEKQENQEAENNNMPPISNSENQFPQAQAQWQQQSVWPNQQWGNDNWSNNQPPGNFSQQWQGMPNMDQSQPVAPPIGAMENAPPLPPLPPGESNFDPDPPGVEREDEFHGTGGPHPPQYDNPPPKPPGVEKLQEEEFQPGFNTPPHSFPSQPPVNFDQQQYESSPRPKEHWEKEWKPPSGNWPAPRGPNGPSWNGRGRAGGALGHQAWMRNPVNQFRSQNQGMVNNNIGTGMDQAKRKVLPAWIREGLERIEQEKQRRLQQKNNTGTETKSAEQPSKHNPAHIKSKFESDSEEESDAELPQEENPQEEEKPEVSEEEQNQLLLIKMRKMLTEVLLEVTNDEISDVAYSVHVKASKAPAKQLAQSSALSSIAHFGVVDGYSSDEESDVVEDKTDDKDGDSDSLDEEAIERKMEIFERIQAERMKKLEDDEQAISERNTRRKSSSLVNDGVTNENSPQPLNDLQAETVTPKPHKQRSPSSSSEETTLKHVDASKEGRPLDKKSKKSRRHSRSSSPDRKRSRSRDRKGSRSRDRKRSKSRERRRSRSKEQKRRRSKSHDRKDSRRRKMSLKKSASRKDERKHSRGDRSPERWKSKSYKREKYETSSHKRRNNSSDDSDDGSVHRLKLDSSSSKSHKKKFLKRKKSSSRKHQSSSSEDSSSSSSSDSSDTSSRSQSKSVKSDKYTRSTDKYRKSHSKKKSRHH